MKTNISWLGCTFLFALLVVVTPIHNSIAEGLCPVISSANYLVDFALPEQPTDFYPTSTEMTASHVNPGGPIPNFGGGGFESIKKGVYETYLEWLLWDGIVVKDGNGQVLDPSLLQNVNMQWVLEVYRDRRNATPSVPLSLTSDNLLHQILNPPVFVLNGSNVNTCSSFQATSSSALSHQGSLNLGDNLDGDSFSSQESATSAKTAELSSSVFQGPTLSGESGNCIKPSNYIAIYALPYLINFSEDVVIVLRGIAPQGNYGPEFYPAQLGGMGGSGSYVISGTSTFVLDSRKLFAANTRFDVDVTWVPC